MPCYYSLHPSFLKEKTAAFNDIGIFRFGFNEGRYAMDYLKMKL
jgi:hypothetical protein